MSKIGLDSEGNKCDRKLTIEFENNYPRTVLPPSKADRALRLPLLEHSRNYGLKVLLCTRRAFHILYYTHVRIRTESREMKANII